MKKTNKEHINTSIAKLYAYNFDINSENTELLIKLVCTKKWLKKEESSIRLAIKKLSTFSEKFQTELLETAISGEYQGLVFPNSKKQEEQFLKNYKPVYEQRRNELENLDRLASAILTNRNV